MKKLPGLVAAVMVLSASVAWAGGAPTSPGPAPNAGDGIADGSGMVVSPSGPNGAGTDSASGPVGPAPNSGDGIPDGSGFEEDDIPLP